MSDTILPFGRHEPELSADEADDLLCGLPPTASASPAARAVGDALGLLSLPPSRAELADERAAVAVFALSAGTTALPVADSADVEPLRRARRRGLRVAIAAAAGSVVLGGVAAAAIGVLPGSTVGSAPTVSIGSPSVGAHLATTASPQTPTTHQTPAASATGGAAHGTQHATGTALIGTVTPAIHSVCSSVLGGPTSTLPASEVTRILGQLTDAATAGEQTLSQLCTRLLHSSADPAPTASTSVAPRPSGVLPVPSLGVVPTPSLPALPTPHVHVGSSGTKLGILGG